MWMNQSLWPLHEIGDKAKGLVIEFFDANKQEAKPKGQSPPARWVRLKVIFIKLIIMLPFLIRWVMLD